MFARNEKYGDALHLQYGPVMDVQFDTTSVNRHFGPSSLLQSLRKRMRLAKEENMMVVELKNSSVGSFGNHTFGKTEEAVNENCFYPLSISKNR